MEPTCHPAKDPCTLDQHELIESDGFFVCFVLIVNFGIIVKKIAQSCES